MQNYNYIHIYVNINISDNNQDANMKITPRTKQTDKSITEDVVKITTGIYCIQNDSIVNFPIGHKQARCGECAGCTAANCKTCKYCRDSTKFGGPGKLKKACIQHACTNMQTTISQTHKNNEVDQPKKPGYILCKQSSHPHMYTFIWQ